MKNLGGILFSSFLLAAPAAAVAQDKVPKIVDLEAIILNDVSTSMSPQELEQVTKGLFTYLRSEEAQSGYRLGIAKVITVVPFAGSSYKQEHKVISSIEDVDDFERSYLTRDFKSHLGKKGSVTLSNRYVLEKGTNVANAFKVAEEILSDKNKSIMAERRVVLLVGDELWSEQVSSVVKSSKKITDYFAATVCPIAINESRGEPPPYYLAETDTGDEKGKWVQMPDSSYSTYVYGCKAQYPVSYEGVAGAVRYALSLVKG